MGFLSKYNGIVRVWYVDGEYTETPPFNENAPGVYWIDFKQKLNHGTIEAGQEILFGGKIKASINPDNRSVFSQAVTVTIQHDDYTDFMLLKSIHAWNLTDENDELIPITIEGIRSLPREVAQRLNTKRAELHAARTPEQEASFRNSDNDSPSDGEGGTNGVSSTPILKVAMDESRSA